MEEKKLVKTPVRNYQSTSEVLNDLVNFEKIQGIGCNCNGGSSANGGGCHCGNGWAVLG